MGCDIHPVIEIRRWGGWALAVTKAGCPQDRNYVSFAILANVRNGYGFAGVPTHEELTPIAEPRGLPADLSPEVRLLTGAEVWLGDHSYSYVTLAEMEAYDLDRQLLSVGFVNAENAALIECRRRAKVVVRVDERAGKCSEGVASAAARRCTNVRRHARNDAGNLRAAFLGQPVHQGRCASRLWVR